MAMALDLARLGLGRTSPNPAVGCVVVRGGHVVGAGFHRQAGLPHAEIVAMENAGRLTRGASLYVTLEPCSHYGRTPPCTETIIRGGIREVYVGMPDPDPRVRGRGIAALKKSGIRVTTGILEAECQALNEAYILHRTRHRPHISLKMALTPEGYVGWRGRGRLTRALQVTGDQAQRYGHAIRDQVDAILVGIGTVLTDDPRLTTRIREGKDPLRVVLDPSLKIPLKARLLHLRSAAKTLIVTARERDEKMERIRALGAEALPCGAGSRRIDLKRLMRILADRGIVSLLVEGGPRTWSSFLRQRLVDRLWLFVAGGRRQLISEGKAVRAPLHRLHLPLTDIHSHYLGADLLFTAKVRRTP